MRISSTCLAALKAEDGNLWFAGDRLITWYNGKALKRPRSKIAKRNNILLAGTGYCVICNLVVEQFPVPKYSADTHAPQEYMHTVFIPQLINWLRSEGWVDEGERRLNIDCTEDELKSHEYPSATFLIGVGSEVYELDIDVRMISCDIVATPYAIGCGGDLALGSLYTTSSLDMTPKNRLKCALKVAAAVSPGCDDNIDILSNKA